MSKRTVRLVFILAVTLGGLDSVSAQQWQTLENEPSRADLFGQFIVPKNRPEGFALPGPDPFAIHDLMIAVSHRSDLGQGQRVRSFYEEKSNDAY